MRAVNADLGRAAELAPHDRHHVLVHAAVVQVLDQVGDGPVDLGQLLAQVDLKFLPCVSQPPIDSVTQPTPASTSRRASQELLDALVAVADARVFAGQVKGLADRAGGDHVEGAGGEAIQALHGAAGVDVAADRVEAGEQRSCGPRSGPWLTPLARRRLSMPGPLGAKAR